MTWLKGLLTVVSLLAGALVAAFFLLGPQWVDRNANPVSYTHLTLPPKA